MTVKEAKEILEKEGCFIITKLYGTINYVKFQPWEKAEVKEAIAFLGKNGYRVQTDVYAAGERNTRLIEEYNMRKNDAAHARKDNEKVGQIVDKLIEEEGETVKGEHLNPALNASAKEFNDALLDEQAKRIKQLEEQRKILGEIIDSRNAEICELQEKVKKVNEMGKQIAHLNEVIGKKNAQIKDYKIACEEHDEQLKDYMLSDKNKDDMISGLKKVNEGLRHKLAEAVISKVDENALKSAESALIYKDKVINKQKKELKKRRMYILQLEKRLHEASTILAALSKSSRCGFVTDVLDRQKEVNRLYNKLYDSIKKMNAKNNAYTGVDLGSEEGDKSGYAIGVCVQQKRLAGYVAELMDEIPEWINFYSKWKKAENSINDMSPEEFDKLFNKMFQNKFVW